MILICRYIFSSYESHTRDIQDFWQTGEFFTDSVSLSLTSSWTTPPSLLGPPHALSLPTPASGNTGLRKELQVPRDGGTSSWRRLASE